MFLRNDIVEFINKIINVENITKEEIENNIKEFHKYLKLTKMADEKTLKVIDKIVDCLPQILVLKQKLGTFDINMFLNDADKIDKNTSKSNNSKKTAKTNDEKHYKHYHETKPSPAVSNCGSTSRHNSSNCDCEPSYASSNCFSTPRHQSSNCGSAPTYTYSSSCGGGSISRSGC